MFFRGMTQDIVISFPPWINTPILGKGKTALGATVNFLDECILQDFNYKWNFGAITSSTAWKILRFYKNLIGNLKTENQRLVLLNLVTITTLNDKNFNNKIKKLGENKK